MRNLDLAYIAGFFDGEGAVSIIRRRNGKPYWLRVQVSQTNREIIKYLHDSFSGTLFKYKPTPNRKDAWQWSVSANVARDFLMQILPYLRQKRNEALIGIAFQKTKKPRGKPLSEEERWVEEDFRVELSSYR